jgi:peptidoglycan/xylan/chitin deacetylase (PgdA/CDA1 family)
VIPLAARAAPTWRVLALGLLVAVLAGCATTAGVGDPGAVSREPDPAAPVPSAPGPSAPAAPTRAATRARSFESEAWIVTVARAGDTAASLAARHLGDARKAWMIEDYNDASSFAEGQQVIVPKRPWNPTGVDPTGYQLVPVLVYHNIGAQAKGRMVIAARAFEEQMRYLKAHGYRVVGLRDLEEFMALGRQLPRRSVVLTFDDGYRSFMQHAYPILKELDFTATLFVYTDYVGAGRNALGWDDLARLAREGFDVQGHSKTHTDLRRRPGEPDADHARRVRAEMETPQRLFEQRLGHPARFLAYPYGAADDEVIRAAREHGYVGAFTVRREGNPAFVPPFRIRRSQIYAEMTLEDFARNLTTFSQEPLR